MRAAAFGLLALLAAGCSASTPPAGLLTGTGTGGTTGTSAGSSTSSTGASSGTTSSSTTGTSSSSTSGSTGSSTTSSSTSGTSGGQDSGMSQCVPGAIPDTCASLGLVCHGYFGMGTCGLPEELDPCTPTTGCASSDLSCLLLFQNSGIYLCLRSCTTVADCPNATTTCFNDVSAGGKICFYNVCGPNWPLPFPALSGPDYYGPCSAEGTNDGVCLPVESQLGTVGVCLQGGTVTSGGVCSAQRVDGGGDQLCTAGTICGALNGAYACSPVCAASPHGSLDGGGPFCAQGSVCANVLSAAYDFGQCLTSCSGSGMCAGSSTCVVNGTQNVCYP